MFVLTVYIELLYFLKLFYKKPKDLYSSLTTLLFVKKQIVIF